MNGRLGFGDLSGQISPQQKGGSFATTAPLVPSSGPSPTIDQRRLTVLHNPGAPIGKVLTKGGWAAPAGAPGAPGSPGGPGAPGAPGTPGGPSVLPPTSGAIVPQTVGTPSWPQQWQSQQAYQQTTVSTPVQVVTQPQLSLMFSPPQPSGDLGPMGTVDTALGLEAGNSSRCLTYAILGMGLAWLFGRKKAG